MQCCIALFRQDITHLLSDEYCPAETLSILVLLMFVGAQGLDHCTSKEIDKIVLQKYELSTKIYMVHFH